MLEKWNKVQIRSVDWFLTNLLRRRQELRWYQCFKEDREDQRLRRHRTSTTDDNVEHLQKIILGNCIIPYHSARTKQVFSDVLGMTCVLNFNQKQGRHRSGIVE